MAEEELFWADQLAKEIANRKKFHYLDKPIPKLKEFTVKTSASLSGVLHIGRLSDTIRGDSVHRALEDLGVKSKLIWVAEDMDPLRKIPAGVPKSFEKYIGVSVSDVPDPEGCHKSYAEHFTDEYFKVLDNFVFTKMKKFSMREEYKKGSFKPFIKKILEHLDKIIEIQNKYRERKLEPGWSPWSRVCEKCGKIITANVTGFKDGKVQYECRDYQFENTTAKGCGYKGENDPLKFNGKLMWKSEWAAQWALWKVCSEGAGKEYQVPNSAFWVNGEICEKVLDFAMPVPIFYEHIMVDGEKMAASKGNVIYPREWLEVASPELLKFFYNKRLMKTRSFSWRDLPKFYDEFDDLGRIYHGAVKLDNKKEEQHLKRLYQISNPKKILKPLDMTFSHAVISAQVFPEKKDIVASLKKTGHYKKEREKEIFERVEKAKTWLEKYAPEEEKLEIQNDVPKGLKLSEKQKEALHLVAERLKEKKKKWNEKTLFEEFYKICKDEVKIPPKEFFKAGYLVLLNKERGPKLANFVLTLGEKAIGLFEKV